MKSIRNTEGDFLVYDEKLISDADAQKAASTSIKGKFTLPYGFMVDEILKLNEEILKCPIPKNRKADYKNELVNCDSLDKEVTDKQKADSKNKYYYNKFILDDSDVPHAFKAMGGKITREVKYVNVTYDDKNNKLTYTDEKGNPIKSFTSGYKTGGKAHVTEVTNVMKLSQADALLVDSALQKYEDLIKNGSKAPKAELFSQLSPKEQILFEFYNDRIRSEEKNKHKKIGIIKHEMKHMQNEDVINIWQANPKSGEISPENEFRLMEDDEKTATLSQAFYNIEQYFKNGEDPKYLATMPTEWMKPLLVGKSKDEIKAFLANHEEIVKNSAKDWDRNSGPIYRDLNGGQFANNMKIWGKESAVHKIGNNSATNDPEYLQQRKLMYQFNIYNPDTGKKEPVQLSQFAKHTEITPEIQNQIINPCEKEINKRKKDLPAEIEALARKLNKDNWHESNRADDLLKLQSLAQKYNLTGQQLADISKDYWSTSDKSDFIKNFDMDKYKTPADSNNNDSNNPPLKIENVDDVKINPLTVETLNGKKSWPEWADENGYSCKGEPGHYKISKNGKDSEIKLGQGCVGVKSLDFAVYQKIVGDAKLDKYNSINIGENMPQEQVALLMAACLEKGMAINNAPETINLDLECLKDLSPEIMDKLKNYNEKKQEPEKTKADTKDYQDPVITKADVDKIYHEGISGPFVKSPEIDNEPGLNGIKLSKKIKLSKSDKPEKDGFLFMDGMDVTGKPTFSMSINKENGIYVYQDHKNGEIYSNDPALKKNKLPETVLTNLQDNAKSGTYQAKKKALMRKGIQYKSANNREIFAQRLSTAEHPDCIKLEVGDRKQPDFTFMYDRDKKTYVCKNHKEGKVYSNSGKNSSSSLPPDIEKKMMDTYEQASKKADNILSSQQNKNDNQR